MRSSGTGRSRPPPLPALPHIYACHCFYREKTDEKQKRERKERGKVIEMEIGGERETGKNATDKIHIISDGFIYVTQAAFNKGEGWILKVPQGAFEGSHVLVVVLQLSSCIVLRKCFTSSVVVVITIAGGAGSSIVGCQRVVCVLI